MLINTFTIISLILAVLLLMLYAEILSIFAFMIAQLTFTISPVYVLTKYVSKYKPKFASYYALLLFIFAQTLLISIIIESIYITVLKTFSSSVTELSPF